MRREGQHRVDVIPTTFPKANAYVETLHRHHAAMPPGFAWFCLAAVCRARVVGVAISGRPTNRNNDNGQTVELLRLATDGTPNAPSALLGACARVARAMGASRIITYTLTAESGSSLRGAGWVCECADTGRSWWSHSGSRTGAIEREHMTINKARWGISIREPISVDWEPHEARPCEQEVLALYNPGGTDDPDAR